MTFFATANLTKSFDGVHALQDVELRMNEGEVLGIIGPNGSGKTTLVNVVTGVLRPTSGDVHFLGKSIASLKAFEIARLGISRTFQNIKLFSSLSILEHVLIGMEVRLQSGFLPSMFRHKRVNDEEQKAREEALQLLAEYAPGLHDIADQPAAKLPYADKRRLEIVKALASRPVLLLLDEPAAGMTPAETRALVSDIIRLKQKKMSMILIEHKMQLVEDVTDRVVVLSSGRKLMDDRFEHVKKAPDVIAAYLGRRFLDAGAI